MIPEDLSSETNTVISTIKTSWPNKNTITRRGDLFIWHTGQMGYFLYMDGSPVLDWTNVTVDLHLRVIVPPWYKQPWYWLKWWWRGKKK